MQSKAAVLCAAVVTLLFLAAAQAYPRVLYPGISAALANMAYSKNLMRPNEQVVIPSNVFDDWIHREQIGRIVDKRIQWYSVSTSPTESGTNSGQYKTLLSQAVLGDSTSTTTANCLGQSQHAYTNWMTAHNKTKVLFDQSVASPSAWQKLINSSTNGEYDCNLTYNYTSRNLNVGYSAKSIMRVDVHPKGWYTPSIPWVMRNLTTQANGPCKGKTVQKCFFKAEGGRWTAIPTGVLVVGDCVLDIEQLFAGGGGGAAEGCNGGPAIAGIIIKKLPIKRKTPCQ